MQSLRGWKSKYIRMRGEGLELTQTIQMLHEATQRLSEASREVFRLAKKKAEAERIYRVSLGQEMFLLREEKIPVTLIPDLARSRVAELKFDRDLSADMYRAALSSMEALKVEINALQSIAKYNSEI